jgi:hypothetical protein
MSWVISARKISLVSETFISSVPSLVTAFLIIREIPPGSACSKRTPPRSATIRCRSVASPL